jgi:predicted AlkP superfamily phosphohydrolase/phosphomutase
MGRRAVSLVMLAALLGVGCTSDRPRLAVTLVGVDGATWRVMDPLLAAGALPRIGRLVASGVRGPLRSQMPLISPPVWTTIATGVSRERHGIREFSSGSRLITSRDRKVPALWSWTSQAGLRTAVLGWWGTYPAEPIDGVMVSERALKLRENDYGRMFRKLDEPKLVSLVHPHEALPSLIDLLAAKDAGGDVAARMRAEDSAIAQSLVRLRSSEGPFALEMLLLRGVDPVSHHYWRFYEPDAPVYAAWPPPSADERAQHATAVQDHYRFVDGLLEQLAVAPSPDHVYVVVSDHGFEAGQREFDGEPLTGMHRTEAALHGVLVMAGGPIRRGARLDGATILDVAPTVLHLLGLPIPEELEGTVLTETLEPEWLAAHPVVKRTLATPTTAVGGGTAPDALEERLREELRALGYLE